MPSLATMPSLTTRPSSARTSSHFNTTLTSPLFNLFPIAPSGEGLGWEPSCSAPNCLPIASWSTSFVNSTLDFSYWGSYVSFHGMVEGSMTAQITQDGQQEQRNLSNGILLTIKSSHLGDLDFHNLSIKIINASPNARLTVTRFAISSYV
ncbi:unnamed protein product [Rhizoctonia solani]|uniref:Uncharacterized protein n=1 Tax=Rhizoctonia solani TaxID=456999 RepID=A0A8H3BUB6_9AGAM|nr:unnamed protein product [Rhizoctonia solani]